jgi:hypothetical protein
MVTVAVRALDLEYLVKILDSDSTAMVIVSPLTSVLDGAG